MKRLLNITMLITALLFVSCKDDSVVGIIGKSTKKNVKILSYSFNSQNEDSAVKSGNNTDSTNKIGNKVLSIETWEVGGEFFTASLIEENDPIATKADITYQHVDGSSVYTFYAYKDSEIKPQSITGVNKTIEVPVDENTNYGMLFLSSADGMNNPKEVNILPTAINKTNKEITYNAKFNENLCYTTFDRETMPTTNPIDVTFKPVFAQLGVLVPKDVEGETISVNSIKLISGAQQTATVKIKYDSTPTSNISYSYAKTTNYRVDLNCGLNGTNDTTILQDRYYNIIPNGKEATVEIQMTSSLGSNVTKTIKLKDKDSQPIKFAEGKRYKLLINNKVLDYIEVKPANDINLVAQPYTQGDIILKFGLTQQLKAIAHYLNGKTKDITSNAGITWSYDGTVDGQPSTAGTASVDNADNKGLVTLIKEGTSKITASYYGKSTTVNIKPNIWKRYEWSMYVSWSASNVAGAISYNECARYMSSGVHWSSTDGYIFLLPDGYLYCGGLWMSKTPGDGNLPVVDYSTYIPVRGVYTSSQNRPTDYTNYFFIPAASLVENGHIRNAGEQVFYWSGSGAPPAGGAPVGYDLCANSDYALLYPDGTYWRMVPLVISNYSNT